MGFRMPGQPTPTLTEIPEDRVFDLDLSGIDLESNESPVSNQNGLTSTQRFVLKNFFDTQPKKRKAYMKQLGYEVKGDKYRPLGSTTNYQPIEEDNTLFGIIPNPLSYFKNGKFDSEELRADFSDVAFDLGVAGPISGIAAAKAGTLGAAKGGAIGSAVPGVGTTVGALVAGVPSAIGGGAAGNAAAEAVKNGVANFILDEEVPMDMREMAVQSLMAGAFSGIFKGGSNMIKNFRKAKAEGVTNMLKEATIRSSNGQLNDNMLDFMIKNPDKFTKSAVKDSRQKILKLSDDIFGTSERSPFSTRQLKGGIAKGKIQSLNRQADLELEKLAEMPEASFEPDELIDLLNERVAHIRKKPFIDETQELPALKFIDRKIKEIKNLGGKESGLELDPETMILKQVERDVPAGPINFKDGRELLKSIQNATYGEGSALKGNNVLRDVGAGLKQLADEKAENLGSSLAKINAARSRILSTYEDTQKMLRDGTMDNAFIGKESTAKLKVARQLDRLDSELGTDMGKLLKTAQFQKVMEDLLFNPKAFGSGSVIKDVIREGSRQARTSSLRALPVASVAAPVIGPQASATMVGASTIGGFVQGARRGAQLSDPEKIVRRLAKQQNRIDKLDKGIQPRFEGKPGIGRLEAEVLGAVPQIAGGQAAAVTDGLGAGSQPPGEPQEQQIPEDRVFELDLEGIFP